MTKGQTTAANKKPGYGRASYPRLGFGTFIARSSPLAHRCTPFSYGGALTSYIECVLESIVSPEDLSTHYVRGGAKYS